MRQQGSRSALDRDRHARSKGRSDTRPGKQVRCDNFEGGREGGKEQRSKNLESLVVVGQ